MKPSEQKLGELTKLKQLAPYPIDSSFITGYLAFVVPLELVPEVRDTVTQIILMVQERLISSHNMLELLIVLRHDLLEAQIKGKKKTLASTLEPYLSQLALDNSYLSRRHFQKEFRPEEIVPQSLGIECEMCLVDIITSDLCCLGCGHMYHKGCLAEYSKEKIFNKHIPFNCPHEDCRNQITQDQINEYLPKDLRQKYEEFTFHNYVEKHMADTSWCPTPGCSAVFTFDAALTDYKCPACKKHYCLACKCEFHTGLSCEEYKEVASLNEEDRKFMMLAKGSKFKQCPNCKFWVEKNQGCDHMTCRCKYEFCYVCGGKYNRCKCKGFVNQVEEPRILLPMSQIRPVQPLAEIAIGMHRPYPLPSQPRLRMSSSDIDSDEIQLQHDLYSVSSRKEIEERRRQQEQRIREERMAAESIRRANESLRRQQKIAEEAKLFQELKKEQEIKERERAAIGRKEQQRIASQERRKIKVVQAMKRQIQEKREMEHQEMRKSIALYEKRNKEMLEQQKKRQNESNARSLRIKEAESIQLKLQEQRERIQSQLKARGPREIEVKSILSEVKPLRKPQRLETQLMLSSSRSEKIEEKQVEQKPKLDEILKKYWNKSQVEEKKEPQSNELKYSFSYINGPARNKPNEETDRKAVKLEQVQRQPINSKDDNQRQYKRFPVFSLLDAKEASRLQPYDNA